MELNLNKVLNHKHAELFQCTCPELCVRGGANAGKSYSIADKLLLQTRLQPDKRLKALIIRKTFPSLKSSILDILERRAEAHGLPLKINRSDYTAECLKMKIVFKSLNNKEDYISVKSMTDIDFIWVNEMTELRELDYDILRMRIRGGESKFSQFLFDFNPIGKTSWVYKRFFENGNGNGGGNGTHKLLYTVLDNPWAKEHEIEKLKAYADIDENLYKIYFKGDWGELEGVIYNWPLVPLPEGKFYDEIFYGLDFGYSVDEAALVRIYRKAHKFWLECVIYEKELTNQALGGLMEKKGIDKKADIYADSAEPKSIQEIYNMGFNIKPCDKGPDSVRAGIDFLKSLDISVLDVDGADNALREQKSYIWKKDKDGNSLNVPKEFDNHAMDGARYGIFTHMKQAGVGAGTLPYSVYPD